MVVFSNLEIKGEHPKCNIS